MSGQARAPTLWPIKKETSLSCGGRCWQLRAAPRHATQPPCLLLPLPPPSQHSRQPYGQNSVPPLSGGGPAHTALCTATMCALRCERWLARYQHLGHA